MTQKNRPLGVLMLETGFDRIPGDIGNPDTFDFPVIYRTVTGATSKRVVHQQDSGLIDLFAEAAADLVREGAVAITTSCGFLARFQFELSARISVPFTASAIDYLNRLSDTHSSVAVITADAGALNANVLGPTALAPTAIVGMENSRAFRSAIIEETMKLDPAAVEREVVEVARQLARQHPELDAVVLECTNLPPYRAAITEVLQIPIYDSVALARGLMADTVKDHGNAADT
ncbi:aspartate/glutamate racemase family protein [Brevibacterium zhoupengii]|uniref:aspartate/glutamate racemase family protein n=1 Tax=Brevibacterium zhoupengii TaxID=2898795 RepID=UPI001E327B5F|nr:aspartate/glutamate racemase family protein [Brevibacterium zhoupengii]